ncbi:MAG: hypothetical protein GC164_16150 [Phycisphaera sp.]|nr:hypothetical protein [Phycisphaera sp.]
MIPNKYDLYTVREIAELLEFPSEHEIRMAIDRLEIEPDLIAGYKPALYGLESLLKISIEVDTDIFSFMKPFMWGNPMFRELIDKLDYQIENKFTDISKWPAEKPSSQDSTPTDL